MSCEICNDPRTCHHKKGRCQDCCDACEAESLVM